MLDEQENQDNQDKKSRSVRGTTFPGGATKWDRDESSKKKRPTLMTRI